MLRKPNFDVNVGGRTVEQKFGLLYRTLLLSVLQIVTFICHTFSSCATVLGCTAFSSGLAGTFLVLGDTGTAEIRQEDIFVPPHGKTNNLHRRKTKTQISFAVTAKLISAFVFATRIVQFLPYLTPKFHASSSFLCLYRLVCVGPVRKPHCWFSHEAAHFLLNTTPSRDNQHT